MKIQDYEQREDIDIERRVRLKGGEYEVISYTAKGPAHTDEYVEADNDTRALLIAFVHEQYNVVVGTPDGRHTVIAVSPEEVMEVWN